MRASDGPCVRAPDQANDPSRPLIITIGHAAIREENSSQSQSPTHMKYGFHLYVSLIDIGFSLKGLGCIEGEPNDKEDTYRCLSRLGSRPPSCRQKCEGCIPCYPTQTPTTTDHIGVQYANYEPVGWKCKCGTSFFNP